MKCVIALKFPLVSAKVTVSLKGILDTILMVATKIHAALTYTERGACENSKNLTRRSFLFLVCSQEEQFFINGNLPDFHQVDIPDIWIGLSGTLHTLCFDAHCETITKMCLYNKNALFFHFPVYNVTR